MGQGLIQCLESDASEFVYLYPLSWVPLGPPVMSNMHLILSCISDFEKMFSCWMWQCPFCLPKKSQKCVLKFSFHRVTSCLKICCQYISLWVRFRNLTMAHGAKQLQPRPAQGLCLENREMEVGGTSKSLLLKSSLQRPGRGWRTVVAVVKVQPGCCQSRRCDDRRTDTTEDCFFQCLVKGNGEEKREARGNSFRKDWLPLHKGQLTAPKRREHTVSPSFQCSLVGTELARVVVGASS